MRCKLSILSAHVSRVSVGEIRRAGEVAAPTARRRHRRYKTGDLKPATSGAARRGRTAAAAGGVARLVCGGRR